MVADVAMDDPRLRLVSRKGFTKVIMVSIGTIIYDNMTITLFETQMALPGIIVCTGD